MRHDNRPEDRRLQQEPASPPSHSEPDACGRCSQPDRRQFIQFSATAILAIAAAKVVKGAGSGDERTYPVPSEDGVTIDHDAQVIVVRDQQRMYAFNLACPHQNTALRWRADDHRFQCPRHQSKYQPDGTFISGRATRNMDRFAVSRSGASLVVDLSTLYRSDQQPAEWAKAFVSL